MVSGDINRAEESLEKAMKYKHSEKKRIAKNLNICKVIKNTGMMNLNDYLLRKIKYYCMDEFSEDDDFDCEYYEYINDYNNSRLHAFGTYLLENSEYAPYEKDNIYHAAEYILNCIDEIEGGGFFYDQIKLINDKFKLTIHKFIFKTRDIDIGVFNDVYTALLEFYKFLQKNDLVLKSEYDDLKKTMSELKPGLIETMLKYNQIRHNPDYSDEEKEKIRYELFEEYSAFWLVFS